MIVVSLQPGKRRYQELSGNNDRKWKDPDDEPAANQVAGPVMGDQRLNSLAELWYISQRKTCPFSPIVKF